MSCKKLGECTHFWELWSEKEERDSLKICGKNRSASRFLRLILLKLFTLGILIKKTWALGTVQAKLYAKDTRSPSVYFKRAWVRGWWGEHNLITASSLNLSFTIILIGVTLTWTSWHQAMESGGSWRGLLRLLSHAQHVSTKKSQASNNVSILEPRNRPMFPPKSAATELQRYLPILANGVNPGVETVWLLWPGGWEQSSGRLLRVADVWATYAVAIFRITEVTLNSLIEKTTLLSPRRSQQPNRFIYVSIMNSSIGKSNVITDSNFSCVTSLNCCHTRFARCAAVNLHSRDWVHLQLHHNASRGCHHNPLRHSASCQWMLMVALL